MNETKKLYDAGRSLWLDNITRDLLTSGALRRYIDELTVTGLTSNPTIFDHAIKNSGSYDSPIRERLKAGKSGEDLFFEIALEDITQAADLFRPIHERTAHVDGWVSLEVSPVLAHDTKTTIAEAKDLHRLVLEAITARSSFHEATNDFAPSSCSFAASVSMSPRRPSRRRQAQPRSRPRRRSTANRARHDRRTPSECFRGSC